MLKTGALKEYLLKKKLINECVNVEMLKTNSKEVKSGDLFLAINNGNNYIEEALKNGASLVIYDGKFKEIEKTIKVENSVNFLQDFSKYYLEKISPIVIAITGSNGKTTTKDILYNILSKKIKGKKTIGNFNNHIGLPLSILQLEEDDKFIILEMGMSALGEIDLLGKLTNPKYGIITNIGESHLEYLKTKENVFKAKTELLKYVKDISFVNGDDKYLSNLNVKKVGFNLNNDFIIRKLELNTEGTSFLLKIEENEYNLKTNLKGKHNIFNLALAISLALKMGIEMQNIQKSINYIKISGMRFEEIEKEGTIFINDAYNASPSSMKASLELFSKLYNDSLKIAVLGDMLELGEESKKYHKELSGDILKTKVDKIFLYGDEMKVLYEALKGKKEVYYLKTKEEIKNKLFEIKEKKVVLLKGSRGMKLEEILK